MAVYFGRISGRLFFDLLGGMSSFWLSRAVFDHLPEIWKVKEKGD